MVSQMSWMFYQVLTYIKYLYQASGNLHMLTMVEKKAVKWCKKQTEHGYVVVSACFRN